MAVEVNLQVSESGCVWHRPGAVDDLEGQSSPVSNFQELGLDLLATSKGLSAHRLMRSVQLCSLSATWHDLADTLSAIIPFPVIRGQ